MSAEIDERLDKEEQSAFSADERSYADACLAALSDEDRATVTELDLYTVVRGYQTYVPRKEETVKALQVRVVFGGMNK